MAESAGLEPDSPWQTNCLANSLRPRLIHFPVAAYREKMEEGGGVEPLPVRALTGSNRVASQPGSTFLYFLCIPLL